MKNATQVSPKTTVMAPFKNWTLFFAWILLRYGFFDNPMFVYYVFCYGFLCFYIDDLLRFRFCVGLTSVLKTGFGCRISLTMFVALKVPVDERFTVLSQKRNYQNQRRGYGNDIKKMYE